jgi:hypothetical protein
VLGLVQRALEQQERLIALTTELKKALLHQLFTQGLRGEPQKQTEIGPVPQSWEVVPLGEYLTEAQYGISVKGSESGRYAVLRMTNQRQGRISPDNLQYVELTPAQFATFRVERQDILFNRTNSLELVGRTAIFDLEGDFVFASYLIRLRTNAARLRPFFLNHYFNWDETQVRLKSIATRAVSQSNISATRLRGFPVPVPPLEEQDEIVSNIDCFDRKLAVHRRKHAALMYLDKPMRDHTLLQAIARVNRPYENEAAEMVKPHGFVLDFVGIFDKLEKALAFDSDEINAIVKDIGLLKHLFKAKMETKARAYLALVTQGFNDKDVDNLIEHFRDKERRKEFFKEYKEIEMLYEIISPDAFLRPFIDNYATLSGIYEVVRNAYARRVYVDRAFQKKTNELVQRHIGAAMERPQTDYITIDRSTIETIKQRLEGKATKVINLVKAIEKTAEENSDDPFLVALAERAKVVQESFEDRQTSTADALAELLKEIEKNEQRKKEQAAKGLDGLTYFVLCKLTDDGIRNAEQASKKVREAFAKYPNWQRSEAELREVRKQVTFAIFAEEDNMEKVTATVEALFMLLQKSFRR